MDTVTVKKAAAGIKKETLFKGLFLLINGFVCFMLGAVSFDGQIFPFAIAMAGGSSDGVLLVSCIGTAAGALVFCPRVQALKYISAAVLLFFIRTAAEKRIKETSVPYVYPALTFACVLVSSLSLSLAFTPDAAGVILELCDAVIAGASSVFAYRVHTLVSDGNISAGTETGDTAAFMLWGSLIMLSFERFSISGFSPARVAVFICVMLLAVCGRENSGTMAGVCAGAVFGMSPQNPQLLFALPLGGLICGLCAPYGKPAAAAAFAVANTLALILKGNADTAFMSAAELAAACVIFLFLPKKLLIAVRKILLPLSAHRASEEAKKHLNLRIRNSARAVRELAYSVEAVCRMLSRTDTPDIYTVPEDVKEDVCRDCLKNDFCWKRTGAITEKAFRECLSAAGETGRLTPEKLPERLGIVCREKNALCDSFNRLLCEHNARLTVRGELFEAKSLAASQFRCAADIMEDAAFRAVNSDAADIRLTSVIEKILRSHGFVPSSLLVSGGQSEKRVIEALCPSVPEKPDYNALLQAVNRKTNIEFMPPVLRSCKKEGVLLSFCEKTELGVKYHILSRTSDGEKLCGDSCEAFPDGRGKFFGILSDGMSTGARAALDSVMTCSLFSGLMKSGFSIDTALAAVNSALAVKSADESLATLDIFMLDLYTGYADIFKAGSSFSVVQKAGRVSFIEQASMPLGILPDTHFEHTELLLGKGDTVLMLSDGAGGLGLPYFKELFAANRGVPPEAICAQVIKAAEKASPSGRIDDITVVCVQIV